MVRIRQTRQRGIGGYLILLSLRTEGVVAEAGGVREQVPEGDAPLGSA
jgi:hypothetical protein